MSYSNPGPQPAYANPHQTPVRRSYVPHPKEYIAADQGPFWGALAALVGGVLISLYGAFLASLGPISGVVSTALVGGALTAFDAGVLLLAYGVVIGLLGALSFGGAHHRLDGAAIWLLIFVMGLIVTGIGFYLASLLALTGGVHIYSWKPRQVGGPAVIQRARGR